MRDRVLPPWLMYVILSHLGRQLARSVVADWTTAVAAPAVVAAVVSVAAAGVAGIARRREERRGWLRNQWIASQASKATAVSL